MLSSSHRSGIYRMRDRSIEGEAGRQAGRQADVCRRTAKGRSWKAAKLRGRAGGRADGMCRQE